MSAFKHTLNSVLNVAITLSKKSDKTDIMSTVMKESMKITSADSGCVFIIEDSVLRLAVLRSISKNIDYGSEGIRLDIPTIPITANAPASRAVVRKGSVFVDNIRKSCEFDLETTDHFDNRLGYSTESLLAVPLVNQEKEVMGVIQLVNSTDKDGKIRPFTEDDEKIIFSFASLAAIEISNIRYTEELREQMWSFTEAMAEAIDNRAPYNANHIRNVARYSILIADYINTLHSEGLEEEYFDGKRRDGLMMSALLHDIGKLVIPLEIMNKSTRLGAKLKDVEHRFEVLRYKYEILFIKGIISENECRDKHNELEDALNLIREVNISGCRDESTRKKLDSVFFLAYNYCDERIEYLTDDEKCSLSVKRGTLTSAEREIMEGHVERTEGILEKVHFNSYFKNCLTYAGQHHEFLDGSGYPRRLTAESLPLESRILAVADIFDALLATDRPYKKPIPRNEAIEVIFEMAKEGKLDEKICRYMDEATRSEI